MIKEAKMSTIIFASKRYANERMERNSKYNKSEDHNDDMKLFSLKRKERNTIPAIKIKKTKNMYNST